MKKRHKGYFKKPTDTLDPSTQYVLATKRTYSKNKKFRIGLWVRLYLRDTDGKISCGK